jgi:replicative DNA helicase
MAPHPTIDATGVLPHNIEAEQQLLGAILSSNDVLDRSRRW